MPPISEYFCGSFVALVCQVTGKTASLYFVPDLALWVPVVLGFINSLSTEVHTWEVSAQGKSPENV